MNSQEQLKEEPVDEYHSKKKKINTKKGDIYFITTIFFVALLIITLIKNNINSYLWLSMFFFILFWALVVSFLSILSKKTIVTLIGCTMFAFCFAAVFWYLSYKNYNIGQYNAQLKYENELVKLTENILNSNLSLQQQQEYFTILFSQNNAQIEIYQKNLKDNVIYKQDFQIEKGVQNYELDTDFKYDILLNKDSQRYVISYTLYKEKRKISLFLSALTFNLIKQKVKTKSDFYFLYYRNKYTNILNSLCFYIPFMLLWIFSLILLSSKEKETENHKRE